MRTLVLLSQSAQAELNETNALLRDVVILLSFQTVRQQFNFL